MYPLIYVYPLACPYNPTAVRSSFTLWCTFVIAICMFFVVGFAGVHCADIMCSTSPYHTLYARKKTLNGAMKCIKKVYTYTAKKYIYTHIKTWPRQKFAGKTSAWMWKTWMQINSKFYVKAKYTGSVTQNAMGFKNAKMKKYGEKIPPHYGHKNDFYFHYTFPCRWDFESSRVCTLLIWLLCGVQIQHLHLV